MAWRDQDQAFVVYDRVGVVVSTPLGSRPSGGTYDVAFGSTCSVAGVPVAMGSGSRFGSITHPHFDEGRQLRTFVVPNLGLMAVDLTVPDPAQPGGYQRFVDYAGVAPPSPAVVCYLETVGARPAESGGWTWTGSGWETIADGERQHVHPVQTSGPANPAYPLVPTGVELLLRQDVSERFTVVDFSNRRVSVASTPVALAAVSIQDPHVCQIPDDWTGTLAGRWLMVATRQRALTGASGGAPSLSINDIVLYVSDDADFAVVQGPFLAVDGLNALGAFADPTSPAFRVWCSVPSAVVDGAYLLVYFMAEVADTSAAFSETGSSSTGFAPGPGVVRVHLDDLEAAVARGPGVEADWESGYGSDGIAADALVAEPLGLVRLFVTDPERITGWYQPFYDRFPTVKAADPAIVIASGVLTLYFAALGLPRVRPADLSGTSHGEGLWRGSDYSEAASHGAAALGRAPGMRGRDFLLRCRQSIDTITQADAPDLVRASNVEDGILADPDPFEAASGSWVVFHGRANTDDLTPLPAGAVVGTREDAVVSYDGAEVPGLIDVVGLETVGPDRTDPTSPYWHP